MRGNLKTALLFAIPLLLYSVGTAYATPPTTGSGAFIFTGPPASTSTRTADGNTITTLTGIPGAITGIFSGTFSEDAIVVTHPDDTTNIHGAATCSCSVSGSSGTIVIRFEGTGDSSGASHGQFVVGGGSGGLVGLHGQGTFVSPGPGGGTYQAKIHFDP